MVYVQDINGEPLMPTTRHGKVRRLLKDHKAVVVNLCPFTIRLMYMITNYKQEVTLGVDAGTRHIGLSAIPVYDDLDNPALARYVKIVE